MISVKRLIFKIQNRMRQIFLSPKKYALSLGVKMGKGCLINTKNFSTEAFLVELGDYVRIAKHTSLFTHGGLWSQRHAHPELILEQFGKIVIGDYSYIGEGCMILPGVSIGKNCIVGAGSVVTKSIPDGIMVAGNPAKVIGRTEMMVKRVASNPIVDSSFYKMDYKQKKLYIQGLPVEKFVHKKYIE